MIQLQEKWVEVLGGLCKEIKINANNWNKISQKIKKKLLKN